MAQSVHERFWMQVNKQGPEKCWTWHGYTQKGYGRFGANGKNHAAHRWLYETLYGALESGKQLDHLCRNRACVNPAHMEPVTRKENILRGVGAPAQNARKTHCKRGHPLFGANIFRSNSNQRHCRACRRERERQSRHASGQWQGNLPNGARTHCPQGHPYSGDNLVVERGRRVCRTCKTEKFQRWYAMYRSKGMGHSRTRTRCPQGHSYSGGNLVIDKHGARLCRECRRAMSARQYARRKRTNQTMMS